MCRNQHPSMHLVIERESFRLLFVCRVSGKKKKLGIMKALVEWAASNVDRVENEFITIARRHARRDFDAIGWENYDPKDPYDYCTFLEEFNKFTSNSEEAILMFVATGINRVLAYIAPGEYVVKRNYEGELFYMQKGPPSAKTRYNAVVKGKVKEVHISLADILTKLQWKGVLRLYKGKTVLLGKIAPRSLLNLWAGFLFEKFSEDDYPPLDDSRWYLLNFIKRGLCGGDEACYKALMKLYKELIFAPWKKIPWGIFFYSGEKGMDKGLWANFLFTTSLVRIL